MKKILALVGVMTLSATAQAAGYGTAGCGLGSLVFQDQGGFVQIFAATLNGTAGSQTFGITSGTSNCGGGMGSASATDYIESNRNALANDISRGQGETLAGLSQVMGCTDAKAVGMTLQKNYRTIFPSQTVTAPAVESTIRQSLKTAGVSCSA
jgi:hypothetical protein